MTDLTEDATWYEIRDLFREQVATLTQERDEARRAHAKSTFGSGDTAIVNNLAEGIGATTCHREYDVARVWWGPDVAEHLYPESAPTPTEIP